jgi:hypothetical protein
MSATSVPYPLNDVRTPHPGPASTRSVTPRLNIVTGGVALAAELPVELDL